MRTVGWALAAILTACAPHDAFAAVGTTGVETWYVRPAGACANNGDGLAYGCAASAGASGAFIGMSNIIWTTTTGVDDNDTLYVCGSHRETLLPASTASGSTGAPIKINFQCPSDRGSIRKSTVMAEALVSGNWVNESTNVWYLSVSGYTYKDPRRVWMSGVEAFPSSAKGNLGVREGGNQYPLAQWWYDSGNQRIYLFSAGNPASSLTAFETLVAGAESCAYTALCIPSDARDFIDIIDPILEGGNFDALDIRAGDNINIYGTTADRNSCRIGGRSPRAVLIVDLNGNGTGDTSDSIFIHDCTISSEIPAHLQNYSWEWNHDLLGDGIHILHGASNITIERNNIHDWTHAHVNVVAVTGTTTITGVTLRHNAFTCQISYCRAFGIDGSAVGKATGNAVIGNMITGVSVRSQLNGNGNVVRGNVFITTRCETITPYGRCQSLDMEGYAGPSQDNTIEYNTFSNLYAACISFRPHATVKSGYLVRNNLLYNCGGSGGPSGVEADVSLYVPDDVSIGAITFLNNLIYHATIASPIRYRATGVTTVSGVESACGAAGDTCSANTSADPQLDANLRPLATSPARGGGIFSYGCIDVRGRICNSPPDVGAYQSSSGDPAAARGIRQ